MGNPLRKQAPPPPSLQVVEGGEKGQHRETRSLSFFFLVLAGLAAVSVIYLAQQGAQPGFSLQGVYEWHMSLNKETANFSVQKERFREQVRKTLNVKNASIEATGIALYLFPELLGETDFQKHEAFELWVPHQRQIEAAPGTLESRIQFERMRNNVWNFETADKQSPILTEPARQMLRVYDELSRPR